MDWAAILLIELVCLLLAAIVALAVMGILLAILGLASLILAFVIAALALVAAAFAAAFVRWVLGIRRLLAFALLGIPLLAVMEPSVWALVIPFLACLGCGFAGLLWGRRCLGGRGDLELLGVWLRSLAGGDWSAARNATEAAWCFL